MIGKTRLERLFNPRSVAVVGASANPGKLGFHVMKSLVKGGYRGKIIPINPEAREIMGHPVCGSLSQCGEDLDLVVVVVPAAQVPGVFAECARRKTGGIALITAGFREIEDPAGGELHERLLDIIKGQGIPVIGPNTYGFVNLRADLNASFTPEFSALKKGSLALVAQSGGISHLLGFLAGEAKAGLSKIIGLGNRLNIDFPEVLEYLMEDGDSSVLIFYLEGLEDPRRLIEAGRRHRGRKPVLVYKAGKARVGNEASRSHTGTLAGRGEIYRGAFRQGGLFEIDDLTLLLDTARALALCPEPAGAGVAILTAQAGLGIVAADICEAEGLEVAAFTAATAETINGLLPPVAFRGNPVDMGPAWYDVPRLEGILKAAMEDENVHLILLLIVFASANAEVLAGLEGMLGRWRQKKPLLCCLSAPQDLWDEEINRLEEAGAIVNYPTPERAARAAAQLWRYKSLLGRQIGPV